MRVSDVLLSDYDYPSTVVVNECELYYAVVYGALSERQAANGAQPADAGTQVGGGGHRVPPVQPAAVDHVQRAGRTPDTPARGFRSTACSVLPAEHGQRGQRQQHRLERRHTARHARETARQQAGHVEKVSVYSDENVKNLQNYSKTR